MWPLRLVPAKTEIAFLAYRRWALAASLVGVLAALVLFAVNGLNYGIDFRGGSQFEVRFAAPPEVGILRRQLDERGFDSATIQAFGDESENTVLIRVRDQLEETSDLVRQVRLALRPADERASDEQKPAQHG